MTERSRDDRRRFASEYRDEQFLDAVGAEWTTISAVAEAVGCDHSVARRRLMALADGGEVEKMKPGVEWLFRTSA